MKKATKGQATMFAESRRGRPCEYVEPLSRLSENAGTWYVVDSVTEREGLRREAHRQGLRLETRTAADGTLGARVLADDDIAEAS